MFFLFFFIRKVSLCTFVFATSCHRYRLAFTIYHVPKKRESPRWKVKGVDTHPDWWRILYRIH